MRGVKVLLLLLMSVYVGFSQDTDEVYYRESIRVLSSDSLGGRRPLSVHEGLTVDYISSQFRSLGLVPGNGDSYYQPVPLLSVKTAIKGNSLVVNTASGVVTLRPFIDYVLWSQRTEAVLKLPKAEYVFVGFGINAPEYGWNDYEGIDVRGKIVVVLVNDPGYYNDDLFRGKNMTYYGRWTYKFEEANRQGAAGALVIHDSAPASYDWSVVRNSWSGKNLSLYSDTERLHFKGWLSNATTKLLFSKSGISYDEVFSSAQNRGFRAIPLGIRSTVELRNDARVENSSNVVGVLEGTDLKDEYLIYTAHWDHFGIGVPIDGDSIYNGADDNASGVAALFVIAKRFKELGIRPRRSIVFLSVTGEESGLLGSEYYAKNPLFPLSKTVANLNMDGYAPRHRTHDVILGGYGDAETDRYVIEGAATQGRIVKPAANQTSGGYYRSDHFNFAKVGVPVVLVSGGRDYVDPAAVEAEKAKYGERRTYHQPTDEYHSWWNVSGSLENIYLLYGIGLRLANESYFPKWNAGVPYKLIREGTQK